DGIEHAVRRYVDAVIGLDHMHTRAALLLRLPEIHDGGKIHVAVNDLVAAAAEVQAAGDDSLAERHVQVHAHRAAGGVHQDADRVPDLTRHVPPLFLPGADTARCPGFTVRTERRANYPRHHAPRVSDDA